VSLRVSRESGIRTDEDMGRDSQGLRLRHKKQCRKLLIAALRFLSYDIPEIFFRKDRTIRNGKKLQ
jgi:ribosome-binding factor A